MAIKSGSGVERCDREFTEATRLIARVLESHVSSPQSPVVFVAGDVLGVGHRDRQWTTYVWVTDERGHAGWVPDTYLAMTGSREALAIRDYDGTDLTIVEGDIVEFLEEAGGWSLCRNDNGVEGWVPNEKIQAVDARATRAGDV